MNVTIDTTRSAVALDSIEPPIFFVKEETRKIRHIYQLTGGIYTFIKKTVVDNPEIENVCVCRLIAETGEGNEFIPLHEPHWINFGGSEKVFPIRITTL